MNAQCGAFSSYYFFVNDIYKIVGVLKYLYRLKKLSYSFLSVFLMKTSLTNYIKYFGKNNMVYLQICRAIKAHCNVLKEKVEKEEGGNEKEEGREKEIDLGKHECARTLPYLWAHE